MEINDEVFKISKNIERAEDLFEMAKERLEILKLIPKDKTYKLVEEYYEIIKELLTAVMYADGYKTLSHIKLIEYFSLNYVELNSQEIRLINILRKFRNEILYYGKKISHDFMINYEKDIKKIIKDLFGVVKKKIKKGKE